MVKMNYVRAVVDVHGGASPSNYYGSLIPTTGNDNIFETRFQIAF